jgi:large subunit ribosomal protein L6
MEKIVNVPKNVNLELKEFKVVVTGEKGKLERDFYSHLFKKLIKIERTDDKIKISSESAKRKVKSEVGTIASHIQNMIEGVMKGYSCSLKVIYMHFPITVKVSGNEITINNFLGEKFPRKAKIVGNCKVEVQGDDITVSGINKEEVGQTATNIERSTKIKSRDRRVFMDGVFLVSKL